MLTVPELRNTLTPGRTPAVACLLAILVLLVHGTAGAQDQTAVVAGTVTDETGGVMQAVTVRLFEGDASEPLHETFTDGNGIFTFDVPVGEYRVQVSAPAFQTIDRTVRATPDLEPLALTLPLDVVEEEVEVDVDPADELRLDPLASLTAQSLSEDELLALPTDEEDLVAYLMLLAGADSSGDLDADISSFIIDGFDQGRLPDLDEIARIIIDPVSMRVDGSGDGPRIEIITRPGSGRWRSSMDFNFADESLDATTPGERSKPARQTRDLDIDLGGPVIPGLVDIDLEVSTSSRERAANSLRAITPTGNVFDAAVRPETEHQLELDADIALSSSRTLGLDLDYETQQTQNDGVGGFTLPERGTNEDDYDWAFQVSERRLGEGLVNDLRFRVEAESSRDIPVTGGVAIGRGGRLQPRWRDSEQPRRANASSGRGPSAMATTGLELPGGSRGVVREEPQRLREQLQRPVRLRQSARLLPRHRFRRRELPAHPPDRRGRGDPGRDAHLPRCPR